MQNDKDKPAQVPAPPKNNGQNQNGGNNPPPVTPENTVENIKEFGQLPPNKEGESPIHCITIIGR